MTLRAWNVSGASSRNGVQTLPRLNCFCFGKHLKWASNSRCYDYTSLFDREMNDKRKSNQSQTVAKLAKTKLFQITSGPDPSEIPNSNQFAQTIPYCRPKWLKCITILFFFHSNPDLICKTYNYLHCTYSTYSNTLNTYSTYDTIQYLHCPKKN